jgi:hypothetical protein
MADHLRNIGKQVPDPSVTGSAEEQSPVESPTESQVTEAGELLPKPIGKWHKTSTSGIEHTGQGPSSQGPKATD